MVKKPYNKRKRFYRRLLVAIAILVVLLVSGLVFLARNMTPILTQKLKDEVVYSSDSLYHITFDGLRVNPFSGNIGITSFRLIPDTIVYNRLKALNRAPENIFDLSVQKLELTHAHPIRLFFKKEVKIKDIRIDHPVIRILHQDLFSTDTTQSVEKILSNLISGSLKSIYVNRIALNNIVISYENNSDPDDKGFSLNEADIIFRDFSITPYTIKDTTRFFYSKDMWLHLVDFQMPTKNKLYKLKLDDIVYSTEQKNILVKGISVKSELSDAAFEKKLKVQKDKIALSIDSALVSGVNILSIFYYQKIGNIKSLELINGDLDIYRDRSLPADNSIKPMPQEMLREAAHSSLTKGIAALFTLDTLKLNNLNVTYRELNPKSERVGRVEFKELKGNFYHLSNDSVILAKNNHCRVDLRGSFMDKGAIHAQFNFDLTDPSCAFSYSGHLGRMKATVLNNATRNLGLVRIKSGNIDRLDFRFDGNINRADGDVNMLYDDLNVKILSLDEMSGRLKNKGVASLVANLLVIKNQNTSGDNAVQHAHVAYIREKQKSVFNLMWKSLFEGVKEIVGMGKQSTQIKKSLKQNKLIQKIREKKEEKRKSENK